MTHSETYRIVKVDMDVIPPDSWIEEWIETRKNMIFGCGYEVTKVRMHPSKKGLHFWFHLDAEVDYDTLMKLQFLCGDDANRVYFGLQRKGFKRFRSMFNILFNRKWKLEKNGETQEHTNGK